MIDRAARNEMVVAIETYMNDGIKAFALDDALCDIATKTKDDVVKEAWDVLWYFYDDLKDHQIVANKEVWNLMCRIILFLQSDAELEKKWIRHWSLTQVLAFGLIVLIGMLAWMIGESWTLLIAWIGAGVLTWEIDRRFHAPLRNQFPLDSDNFPFDSPLDIFRAAKQVPNFHKRRFPPELAKRRIRNALLETEMHLPCLILLPLCFIGWTIVLPFVLFKQLFPTSICKRSVTILATSR